MKVLTLDELLLVMSEEKIPEACRLILAAEALCQQAAEAVAKHYDIRLGTTTFEPDVGGLAASLGAKYKGQPVPEYLKVFDSGSSEEDNNWEDDDTPDNDFFDAYENEPIGDGNPYYRCVDCKRSDPEINGLRSRHRPTCKHYRPK